MLSYFKMAYLWNWMSTLTSEKGKIYQNSMRECDVIFLSGHDHQDDDLFLLNRICVNVMFYFYQMVIEILRLNQRSFLLKPILRVCWCLTLYFTCQWSQLGYLAVSFFRSVQNACLKPPEQRRNILRLFSRITRIWVYWWWSFWLQWICLNVMLYFLLDENKISNWKIFAKKGLTQCFWNKKFSKSNKIVM